MIHFLALKGCSNDAMQVKCCFKEVVQVLLIFTRFLFPANKLTFQPISGTIYNIRVVYIWQLRSAKLNFTIVYFLFFLFEMSHTNTFNKFNNIHPNNF